MLLRVIQVLLQGVLIELLDIVKQLFVDFLHQEAIFDHRILQQREEQLFLEMWGDVDVLLEGSCCRPIPHDQQSREQMLDDLPKGHLVIEFEVEL